MKKNKFLLLTFSLMVLAFMSCSESKPAAEPMEEPMEEVKAPDMAAIKTTIQEIENKFATATTNKDVDAVVAFYSDDAVSMSDDEPMVVGKEAIKKDIEEGMAKRKGDKITTFEVMGVYGSEDQVTETGKTIVKDKDGKVVYTGKYMAIWEKRNGEYLCIADISNADAPEKK
ncbi:MAG: DUF4440 domain-containing protein [Saprospiraceae bacterium]|nr:DUF4440 domain-containing protein [Saprospiraceae bacterium]